MVWWDISVWLFYHALCLFLYVTVTCVLYIALFNSIGSCYVRSKALLNVLHERKYGTAGPNTAPGQPHPTGMNRLSTYIHYIVIDKQENTCYIHGSLPPAHTRPPSLCKRDIVPLFTLILIIALCYIYRVSREECARIREGVPYVKV